MNAPTIAGKNILVTGGAGFIGSHIARTLVDRNDVTVLDDCSNGDPDRLSDEVELLRGDVRSSSTVVEGMENVDIVFHEAALVSVTRSVNDPRTSHTRNARGTLEVLEAARKHDSRVVLASSAAIYGRPQRLPISEEHPKRPISPYGLDKLALDHYGRLYHELYGLETVCLRYFNVYGPGQPANDYSGVISTFHDRARNDDELPIFGDGEQTRDFVHVSDVVAANLLASTTDHVGEAYNVGSERRVSITELAELIAEYTDSNGEIVHESAREGDVRHSGADIAKARTELGFEPSVSLERGIRDLVTRTKEA
ncbi:NAD-dependent epimerase/dehydratase family protein [Natronococcus sp. A-GB1]|nr:NAD-dependent epimerase/dehydratase family protein [Natronococcus sp. A-GB1]MDG5761204.1 NAD-dependent epimerase/dehydratase family protein [Natronococcus sp. A-GB1]